MADSKQTPQPEPSEAEPAGVSNSIRALSQGKIARDVYVTVAWQIGGKLLQLVGIIYAARCLGSEKFGISGPVLVTAALMQVVFTLGMDIVAVRHVAAKTADLKVLTPAIFTFRLILHATLTAIWYLVTLFIPFEREIAMVWYAGGLYFFVLGMNFQWYFQARERMPLLSRIQTLMTLGISIYFLAMFREGQAVGSELFVMLGFNLLVTVGVWWRIYLELGVGLIRRGFWQEAKKYLNEGRANWLFGLAYNFLTSIGMLAIPRLVADDDGDEQTGYFRSSYQIVMSIQFLLSYVGYVIYPRIVVWYSENRLAFIKRVNGLAFGVVGIGVILFVGLSFCSERLFELMYEAEFLPGAKIFPVMVLGKFVGFGSGILVWALLAARRDWLVVKCAAAPVLLTFLLHFWLIPRYGFTAAGALYGLGEMLLFGCCWIAFQWIRTDKREGE